MCTFSVVWEGEFQSFISRRCATGCFSEPVVDSNGSANTFSPILDSLNSK